MHYEKQDAFQDPPVVCRVTPDGEVICDSGTAMTIVPQDQTMRANLADAIQAAFPGEWGPNKIQLALNLLSVLGQSTIPDSPNVPRRAAAVLDSARDLMSPQPPSIMLFNFSEQPANVLGAWFQNRAELVRMQKMYEIFKRPIQP